MAQRMNHSKVTSEKRARREGFDIDFAEERERRRLEREANRLLGVKPKKYRPWIVPQPMK